MVRRVEEGKGTRQLGFLVDHLEKMNMESIYVLLSCVYENKYKA